MDYEVERCTRHCAVTGREFAPGEEYYSVVVAEGAKVLRRDYAKDAWPGPPEGALGWWKSQMPGGVQRRKRWAPNDVMLQVFDELEAKADQQDLRYVLALLLCRRRVMRQEETERDDEGREVLVLYCPRRDATYRILAVMPEETRIGQIQDDLARLLQ